MVDLSLIYRQKVWQTLQLFLIARDYPCKRREVMTKMYSYKSFVIQMGTVYSIKSSILIILICNK